MRRLFGAILLTLCAAVPSWAQMAAVSSHSANSRSNLFAGTNTYNYTFGGNTIASGNLVVVFVGTEIRTVSSISGTNLTMSSLGQSSFNAANFIGSLWYGISTGSVTSATVTVSGNTSDNACIGYVELSGEAASQAAATFNSSANDNVTAHDSGSVTPPTTNNAVVVAGMRTSATWTEDGAFTLVSSANAECLTAYVTQTSATAQNYNSTSDINRYSVMTVGAFAGEAGGGGGGGATGGSLLNMFKGRLQVNP